MGLIFRRIAVVLLPALLTSGLLGCGSATAPGLEGGIPAYERGGFEATLRELRPLANRVYADTENMFLVNRIMRRQGEPQHFAAEMMEFYRGLADQGNGVAQLFLGIKYAEGKGVPKDLAAAGKWFRMAADQGLPEAQFVLGLMHAEGQGVPQNYVQAHMWLSLAAEHEGGVGPRERPLLEKRRNLLEKRMTPAQIAEARRLAGEWKAKAR